MNGVGRPEYTDEQFQAWLNDMAPFLKSGNSLFFAIEKAKLSQHKDSIYRKSRLNDWFCEKIQTYQQYPGEIVNNIFTRLVLTVDKKVRNGSLISNEDWRNIRFFAEKHRSCQPFFLTKTETTQIDPIEIGRVFERLEINKTDYTEVAKEAEKSLATMEIPVN